MFSWLRTRQRAPVQGHRVPALRFVGEQDGNPERELKTVWAATLAKTPGVTRAFLALAVAGDDAQPNVLLCICPRTAEQRTLVEQLAAPFHTMFDADQHVDIVFLDAAQESDVSRVAKPFFSAT
jgi:hypothetical protein